MAHDKKHGDPYDAHKSETHVPEAHKHETHDGGYMRNPGGAHEHSDVNVRAVFGFLIILMVAIIVIQLGLLGMFSYLQGAFTAHDPEPNPMVSGERRPPQQDPIRDFPQPRLQKEPALDVNKVRIAEDKLLQSPPTWVDEKAGVVRIPIEQAMQLTLERGLPLKGGAAPMAAVASPAPANAAPAAATTTKGVRKK